jgi:hypothetical protein
MSTKRVTIPLQGAPNPHHHNPSSGLMVEPPSRCSPLISQSTEAHGISSLAPRHVTPQRGRSPSGGSLRRSHNEVQHGGTASAKVPGASWLQCGGDEPILATAEADAPPPISVTLSSDFVWRCLRLRAVDAHLALLPVLDQQLAQPSPAILRRALRQFVRSMRRFVRSAIGLQEHSAPPLSTTACSRNPTADRALKTVLPLAPAHRRKTATVSTVHH